MVKTPQLISKQGGLVTVAAVSPDDEKTITRIMGFLKANSKYKFNKSDVKEIKGTGKLVVFFLNEKILGVAFIHMFDPSLFKEATREFPKLIMEHMHLQWFVVNKKTRGQGYGKIMMNYLVGYIQRTYKYNFFSTCIKEDYLSQHDAKTLHKIFEDLNFVELGRIPSGKKYFDHIFYIRVFE